MHRTVVSVVIVVSVICATARAAELVLSNVTGRPGEQVSFDVWLNAPGELVSGTQNDIGFAQDVTIGWKATGRPDCTMNDYRWRSGRDFRPIPRKGPQASFAFRPNGCAASECDAIRALLFTYDDPAGIPDGALLYSCAISIAPDAQPGNYPLSCRGVILGTPNGERVADAGCRSSEVTVLPCAGDCDTDGHVTVDELVIGIRVAQDLTPLAACASSDDDEDGTVTIDELVAALNNLMGRCGW